MIYNREIGIPFELDNCAQIILKRGKLITSVGFELPEGNKLDVQSSCKCHVIPQANGNYKEAVGKSATAKYLKRVEAS